MELNLDKTVKVIVIVGEVGVNMEEDAAKYISKIDKPIFAFIAGKTAPMGIPMGHAGALIENFVGTANYKIKILRNKGIKVMNTPDELFKTPRERKLK